MNNTDTASGTPAQVSYAIVVDTTADTNPVDLTSDQISLREAIEISNGTIPLSSLTPNARAQITVTTLPPSTLNAPRVPNTIDFNIPGSGLQTISVGSALPAISTPLIINGYSEPGLAPGSVGPINPVTVPQEDIADPLIQLDGSGLSRSIPVDGLDIQTSNCVIDGLIVTGFSGRGISISGANSQGNWLWGNFLGTLPDSVNGRNFLNGAGLGNDIAGVQIDSSNNTIGGNDPGQRNIIDNNGDGLILDTSSGVGTLVEGNFILDNLNAGVLVISSNNTIGQQTSGGGNVISGNASVGILITGNPIGLPSGVVVGPNIQGNGVFGNVIGLDIGNYVGISVPGTFAVRPRIVVTQQLTGIDIENSSGNAIGNAIAASQNIIAGNVGDGIDINGLSSVGNTVAGNLIGFSTGDSPAPPYSTVLANLTYQPNENGIVITSPGNTIGGSATGAANTISNNRQNGIVLSGAGAQGNTVLDNIIGLTPDGSIAIGNAFDGILVDNAPSNLMSGNTISGNNHGVVITDGQYGKPGNINTATGNLVQGNLIGTDGSGSVDLGNAVYGVWLDNAPLNTIGGTASGQGNTISGNNYGVVITGAGAMNNLIQGNDIGTSRDGKSPLGNSVDGVLVDASNNTIGGLPTGAGNTIENNVGFGVDINSGTGNAILSNSIFGNLDQNDAVTLPAPPDPGGIALKTANNANHDQVDPVLTAVLPNGPATSVQGSLTALANTTYTLQFFSSNAKDPSGSSQGQTLVDTVNVTTDATGKTAFSLTVPAGIVSGQWVTATATDPTGNTSAFSNSVIAVPVALQLGATSYTVNEKAGALAITVTRTGGQGGSVSVNFTVSGGTATAGVDFTAVSGTLYFNPGDPATKTFTVPILDAQKVSGAVTVNVALSNPGNGATLGNPASATLTIQDTDQPAIGFSGTSPYTFYGAGVAYFTVTRNTSANTATVKYTTSNGTALAGVNYTATSGTLTFNPGQTSQVVPVTILDDSQFHNAPLTFGLTLSQPTGTALGPNSSIVASDVTSNAPGVFQLTQSTLAVAPGGTTIAITVVRTGGKTGAVSVNYATGLGTARPGVDYTPTSGTLHFSPGQTSQVVYVPVVNTGTTGASPTFVFGLGNPTAGATLGPLMNTTVTLVHPTPGANNPAANVPSTVSEVFPVATTNGFNQVVITFTKAMDPTRATNAANYRLTVNGKAVPIARAGYDPTANHTVLFLGATVPFGAFAQLFITGLADTNGVLFDGSGTGKNPGSAYSALIGEGSQLTYIDRSGNTVGLKLTGPGLIVLRRSLDGEAQELRFVGATPNLTILTGTLVARAGTAGTTSIASITGASGVTIRLPSPPFYLGGITP